MNITGKSWFSSDWHFNHANIIRYSHRPFSNVQEMDQCIINNINRVVAPNDTLFFLGDFCFTRNGPIEATRNYLNSIACKNIVCILGNHDPHDEHDQPNKEWAKLFNGCFNLFKIKVNYNNNLQTVILSHYSMNVWNHSHHGAWNLFGHSHNSLPYNPNVLSIDVGVDSIACLRAGITMDQAETTKLNPYDYSPVDIDEIGSYMKLKNFKPIDHHT